MENYIKLIIDHFFESHVYINIFHMSQESWKLLALIQRRLMLRTYPVLKIKTGEITLFPSLKDTVVMLFPVSHQSCTMKWMSSIL